MKKTLSLLLVVTGLLSVSCSQTAEAPKSNGNAPTANANTSATPADKSADNVKMYTQLWVDIVNNKKMELLDTAFSDDVVLKMPAMEVKGKPAYKKYWEDLLKAFSDSEFKVEEAFGKDDRVVKRWTFTGTQTGELAGIKPTNKKIKLSGMTIARIKDGKVVEEIDYADDLGMMQQLGAVK